MFRSPLQRAITRGMKPAGDLADELYQLGEYSIKTARDAKTICRALSTCPLPKQDDQITSPLHALTGLFQDVEGPDVPAFEIMRGEGIEHLVRIFDTLAPMADDDVENDLMFMLKIMALYATREGAEAVIRAARMPFLPDSYMWHVVMSVFSSNHPARDFIFDALHDPLPQGFIAVGLLDVVNEQAIEGSWEQEHLFDSPEGKEQLRFWLANRDPENFSYAHSATAALPFISNPERDQLLALAMDHADGGVQMEAAWASGKLGSEAGLKMLSRFCLDINRATVAARYLDELDREDMIPNEAFDDTFQAKAEFVNWLSHPSELGEPPDEVEVVDQRVLAWPPDGERKPFWLIKYLNHDEEGLDGDDSDCGLVGSMTWCFFTYQLDQRPPEDCYGIHCYFEMQHHDLINEIDVEDPNEYASMLGQWQGETLGNATMEAVTEVSHKLKYPQQLVGLASAELDGKEGWVVLDGPRSAWYPASEVPEDSPSRPILMAHVGRVLLGFTEQPDRKKYLCAKPAPDAAKIVASFEQHLAKLRQDEREHEQIFESYGTINQHFESYVEAKSQMSAESCHEIVAEMYGSLLQLAADGSEELQKEVFTSPSNFLGKHVEKYVDALVHTNQTDRASELIATLAPWWDHVFGYSELGTAAFKTGDFETAARMFKQVQDEMKQWFRSETMSYLAEIWCDRGDQERAHELLLDCLRKTNTASKSAKGSDVEFYEEKFQTHRNTYLRLFADRGEQNLTNHGIPVSTLNHS